MIADLHKQTTTNIAAGKMQELQHSKVKMQNNEITVAAFLDK